MRSRLRLLVPVLLAAIGVLAFAAPATAAAPADKPAVLSSWTQPNTASRNSWNSARANQSAWSAYGFDWSTDYCSDSPDQPLGFDFRIPCWRHDFGYRNYKAIGAFSANKSRLDDMLYFDLRAKCATYNVLVRSSCNGLAWTYYQAVRAFGSLQISDAQLRYYGQMKSDALAAAPTGAS
jgi:hypothetical protein